MLSVLAVSVALATSAPASAHHSFAMFDSSRESTIRGTIKEFQWTNPHVWIQVSVPGANGREVVWSIEGSSPNSLRRQGWSSSTFKPGDRVTITMNPLKNGDPGGSFVRAVMPDGSNFGRPQIANAR
ncbi:DUF6152 family protein [Brevundimonas sp. GN22]